MPKLWLILICLYIIFSTWISYVDGTVASGAPVYIPGVNIGGVKTGCPCFFDPDGTKTGLVSANECACCPNKYLPCGYPNHKRCYKKNYYNDGERGGCQGVPPYGGWTLSTIGAPCHFNLTDYTCAICTARSYQCGNYAYPPHEHIKVGSYCREYDMQWNHRCWGNIQDCRNNPLQCDENAKCKSTKIKIADDWTRYACQCKNGYVGNGFSCVKDSSDYDDLVDIVDLM